MLFSQADLRLKVPLTDPAWAEARRGVPPANAGREFPPEILTPDEVARLLRACSTRGPSGIRNRALIVTLWRGGLRINEAVHLLPSDLDLANGLVRVRKGKGKPRRRKPGQPAPTTPPKARFRTAAIDPGACAILELWLEQRRRMGVPTSAPLFCTIADDVERNGERFRRLSPVYARNLLKRLARVAAVEKRVHPHALRHTCAFEMGMEGLPLHVIQAQLGHESLATTGRYMAHIAPRLLADLMSQRIWPEGVPGAHDVPALAAA